MSTRWPGPADWTRPCSSSRRCSPTPTPRALFRGDRPDRRAAWQLPPGLHPPRADQPALTLNERLDRRADG